MFKVFFVLMALLSSLNALASPEVCPVPQGFSVSIQASKQAMDAKVFGVRKETLQKGLRSDKTREEWITNLLNEIVDEVYSDEGFLDSDIYAFYRGELCFVNSQVKDKIISIDFNQARPLLLDCEKSEEKPICALKVVHQLTGIPLEEK